MSEGFKWVCMKDGCSWSNLFETPAIEHSKLGKGHAVRQIERGAAP